MAMMNKFRQAPRDAPYPVINDKPRSDEISANMSKTDYSIFIGLSVFSVFPVGYFIGGKSHRLSTMAVTGFLGSVGGYLLGFQQSTLRLMGLQPNEQDVLKYVLAREMKMKDVTHQLTSSVTALSRPITTASDLHAAFSTSSYLPSDLFSKMNELQQELSVTLDTLKKPVQEAAALDGGMANTASRLQAELSEKVHSLQHELVQKGTTWMEEPSSSAANMAMDLSAKTKELQQELSNAVATLRNYSLNEMHEELNSQTVIPSELTKRVSTLQHRLTSTAAHLTSERSVLLDKELTLKTTEFQKELTQAKVLLEHTSTDASCIERTLTEKALALEKELTMAVHAMQEETKDA